MVYKAGYFIFKPNVFKNFKIEVDNYRKKITNKVKKIDITNIIPKSVNIKDSQREIFNIKDILAQLELNENNIYKDIKNIQKKKDTNFIIKIQDIFNNNKEYIIDHFDCKQKKILIEYLIKNKENLGELDKYYKLIKKYIIRINSLIGYKIAINNKLLYFKYDGKSFKELERNEKLEIQKNNKIKNKLFNLNPLIGYLEEKLPSNEINLKLRDTEGEGFKGTHKRKGSICGNDGMKKPKINEYLRKIDKNEDYTKLGKKGLCLVLELLLRNLNSDTKKYFFNCEEFIEFF